MAKRKPNLADFVASRKAQGLNQSEFWSRYGVTQSGGSRYESGRAMPGPLKLLVQLHLAGVVTEADLVAARKALDKA